jgi:hypothetical protein
MDGAIIEVLDGEEFRELVRNYTVLPTKVA